METMTIQEVADEVGVTTHGVRAALKRGDLTRLDELVGGRVRITKDSVKTYRKLHSAWLRIHQTRT